MESVGIVRFLMTRPASPDLTRSIDAAVAWLRRVRLDDSRWARFYELGTNRPIFLGRDSIVRYAYNEIEYERRNGYAYYGTWPATLLDSELPRWREKRRSAGRMESLP